MAIPPHTHPGFLPFITLLACHQSFPQRSQNVEKGRPELKILSVPAGLLPHRHVMMEGDTLSECGPVEQVRLGEKRDR